MNSVHIRFHFLDKSHFPLLLKWLEAPHVKAWWDQEISWTPELIEEKYHNYTHQYKELEFEGKLIKKTIYAYVISFDGISIGYIQYYDMHDFPLESSDETIIFPESSAALDWYIGEQAYIGKGIGSQALKLFLKQHVFNHFEYAFVESDTTNLRAIKTYQKIGFKTFKVIEKGNKIWMVKEKMEKTHD